MKRGRIFALTPLHSGQSDALTSLQGMTGIFQGPLEQSQVAHWFAPGRAMRKPPTDLRINRQPLPHQTQLQPDPAAKDLHRPHQRPALLIRLDHYECHCLHEPRRCQDF